ncbi:MAG: hypothetical protein U0790_02170 [Isosphaeraceae bacterium]
MLNQVARAEPAIHEAAIRTARQCRTIIQAVLREEEWPDADREFYLVIREAMEHLLASERQ